MYGVATLNEVIDEIVSKMLFGLANELPDSKTYMSIQEYLTTIKRELDLALKDPDVPPNGKMQLEKLRTLLNNRDFLQRIVLLHMKSKEGRLQLLANYEEYRDHFEKPLISRRNSLANRVFVLGGGLLLAAIGAGVGLTLTVTGLGMIIGLPLLAASIMSFGLGAQWKR